MRLMYDSVRASAIPADAEMVAGYVDGIYAWSAADWARFPNAVKVEISAVGTDRGTVVDVEQGCVWPPENAVPWVQRARSRGIDPTVYCNWQNDLTNVKAAFIRAGVPEPHYWVAKYDGFAEVPAGTVGKQYRAPEAPVRDPSPGHYDMSAIADHWPGVDMEEDEMGAADFWNYEITNPADGFSAPVKDWVFGTARDAGKALDALKEVQGAVAAVPDDVWSEHLNGDPLPDGTPFDAPASQWVTDRARDSARLTRLEALTEAIAAELGVTVPDPGGS